MGYVISAWKIWVPCSVYRGYSWFKNRHPYFILFWTVNPIEDLWITKLNCCSNFVHDSYGFERRVKYGRKSKQRLLSWIWRRSNKLSESIHRKHYGPIIVESLFSINTPDLYSERWDKKSLKNGPGNSTPRRIETIREGWLFDPISISLFFA